MIHSRLFKDHSQLYTAEPSLKNKDDIFSCKLLGGVFVKFTLLFSFSQWCYFWYKLYCEKACLKYVSEITCLIFRRDYVLGWLYVVESWKVIKTKSDQWKDSINQSIWKNTKEKLLSEKWYESFFGLVVFTVLIV